MPDSAPPAVADAIDPRLLQRFDALAAQVARLRPNDDHALLRRAFDYAARLHRDQRRRSGEAFIEHPLAVASVLADMRMDCICIAAGILHDAVEDTPATIEEIQRAFGPTVAHLVDGVTRMDRLDLQGHDARQAEYVRKMLLAMADDIRVILIKLADRLHNMRTLAHLAPARQLAIARETMEIYAPLAHRLGMGIMRGELEDLAFSYLEPSAYAQIQAAVDSRRAGGEEFLASVKQRLLAKLAEHEIPARVEGRIKRIYSIYQKLQRQRVDVDQVYDLFAVRIITDSIRDCYAVLGVVHSAWHPVPGRIKDFIATPRPNLYRSLHTSVIDASGQPFEVQIRTEEMHRMAEEGIAAHWKYKDGPPAPGADERILWLRRVLELQQETSDPAEFLSTFKGGLAPEEVYAFTPKGRIIELGRDATPVDFAYAIHTEIGNRCVGARVNGRIVPLRYQIRTGDIVEIMTQAAQHPSRDWLAFVKTSRARQKIRHWLNVNERHSAVEIGRSAMDREARRLDTPVKLIREDDLDRIAPDFGLLKAEEVYAAVGFGKVSARQVLARLLPPDVRTPAQARRLQPPQPQRPRSAPASPILVRGFSDLMVYRAACCNPVHGEPIVGYITRGKGVAVHATDCPNVEKLFYESDRRIDVAWADQATGVSPVRLLVFVADSAGILNAITAVISERGTNIRDVSVRSADGSATIEVVVDVANAAGLSAIVQGLKRIPGVHGVERIKQSPATNANAGSQ